MKNNERQRGVVSQADRDWLQNPDKYSRQAGYQCQGKVRQRLHNAILDFGFSLNWTQSGVGNLQAL